MEQNNTGTLMEDYLTVGRYLARQAAWNRHHEPLERLQGRILALLAMKGMEEAQLAELLAASPSDTGKALENLEEKGWVSREGAYCEITPLGIEQAGERKKPEQDPFACLSREEREILAGYLDRLRKSCEEQGDEPKGFWFGRELWGISRDRKGKGGWGRFMAGMVHGHGFDDSFRERSGWM